MAVRIRLKRMGAKKRPFYRLVVADSRAARDGRFIATIGHYDPVREPEQVVVDVEQARAWIAKGAQPSETAKRLLRQAGVLEAGGNGKPGPVESALEQPKNEAAEETTAAQEAEAEEPAAAAE